MDKHPLSPLKSERTNTKATKQPHAALAELPGIGVIRGELLKKLGISSRLDLLYHTPSRYEDRSRFASPSSANDGDTITIFARVHTAKLNRWRGGKRVLEVLLQTLATPAETFRCIWLNASWYPHKVLLRGVEVVVYGKVKQTNRGPTLYHPEFELMEKDGEEFIHLNRLTPIYPLTEGLFQRVLRRIQFQQTQKSPLEELQEFYPAPEDLPSLKEAIPAVHFPSSWEALRNARQRLIFDEFFLQQCILYRRRQERARLRKDRVEAKSELARKFLEVFPYTPTSAQRRSMAEIDTDLDVPTPMNRLLQGDVGSGKTLVAIYAMLRAVERGEQAALMAPTEILAEQHYLNLKRWLEPLNISVGLHTSNRKTSDRSPMDDERLQQQLFAGRGAITIGTHALLYESFSVNKLGLVVIDEQHKFGVMQRLALTSKAGCPDVLVMTATPIPRTLAMTVYGDLDVSILDELPPGRGKVSTHCRSESELPKVWKFIRDQLSVGRQAYVVYPLIDESDKVEAKAVQSEYEKLVPIFDGFKVGLLHGRLKPDEKEEVMRQFRENKVQLLVSTPVIEVGVDVSNATIMVIENAERFGLAQLHQLRGRIGRGGNASYCILVGQPRSLESWKRLKIMEETTDGFRIAEEDLKIRGPGDILGTEQSGLPPLRFGDPLADIQILHRARQHAGKILLEDPQLKKYPLLKQTLSSAIGKRTLATVS